MSHDVQQLISTLCALCTHILPVMQARVQVQSSRLVKQCILSGAASDDLDKTQVDETAMVCMLLLLWCRAVPCCGPAGWVLPHDAHHLLLPLLGERPRDTQQPQVGGRDLGGPL
jgi:hypothetical protein